MDYLEHDMTGLAELVASGETNPLELLDLAIARTEAVNDKVGAVVLRFDDVAREKAAGGLPDGPFKGVPFLLKDLSLEAVDYPSIGGSRMLVGTTYSGNAEMTNRMLATGLNVFGRTAAPEGGIGPATESVVYGAPTRNPWDLSRTAGGSSGGAGAAVAAGIVPGAHGSDGGGSVRIPAASCGLVGFKPTRARLPEGPYSGEGWAGMATDGFLTRSVRDTATLLDACTGSDLGEPYSAPPLRMGFAKATEQTSAPLRIALCDTTFTGQPIDPACRDAAHEAAKLLEDMGHHVEPACPTEADTQGMMVAWTKIVACGTALWVRSKLAQLGRDLRQDDLENVARSAIRHAESVSGADYLEAVNKVHAYGRELAVFFKGYDVLLTPTLAEPPAKIGRFAHDREDYVDYRMGPDGVFGYSPYTAAFNASGQPAVSLPLCESDGLPIGIHLAAPFGEDERLMTLSAELERAKPWFHRRPAGL